MTQNPLTHTRQQQNLTRADFCRKSGLSISTAAVLEAGIVNEISHKNAVKIAMFMHGDPEQVKDDYKKWRETLKEAA